jgi:DNA-binding PadR family transcriptional regulator
LNQHELVALVTVMQNGFLSQGYVSGYQVKSDMNNTGFTDIAVGISLRTLQNKGMIESELFNNTEGDPYAVYKVTPRGEQWLIDNQDMLTLKSENKTNDISNDVPF